MSNKKTIEYPSELAMKITEIILEKEVGWSLRLEEILKDNKKETIRIEWLKHYNFIRIHYKQAIIAKEPMYEIEMRKQFDYAKNWYEKIYGEKPNTSELEEEYK